MTGISEVESRLLLGAVVLVALGLGIVIGSRRLR